MLVKIFIPLGYIEVHGRHECRAGAVHCVPVAITELTSQPTISPRDLPQPSKYTCTGPDPLTLVPARDPLTSHKRLTYDHQRRLVKFKLLTG